MKFYGREEEIESLRWQLQRVEQTKVARMTVVTGRRRIGKTTLIVKAFENVNAPFLYYFAIPMRTEKDSAESLVAMAAQKLNIRFPPAISNLADAISWLLDCSKAKPIVLVIDECQAFERLTPNFWAQLQRAWDLGKEGAQLLLVMSGSVQSAMERIFGSTSQPLFGRADQLMIVRPFSTSLVGQIFLDHRPAGAMRDLLFFYALTGGVARYVELLADADALSTDEMLSFVFSERGSWFWNEGQTLLANEFRVSAPIYLSLLQKLASGRSKRTELQDGIETDISPYLSRLERLYGMVARIDPIFKKDSRKIRFRIADPYMRFWFTFLCSESAQARMELKLWNELIGQTRESLPTFLGETLEDWFRLRFMESGHWDIVGRWWDRRGENEIDLIAFNRKMNSAVIAEVKGNADKYNETRLRIKAESFLKENSSIKECRIDFRGLSPEDMLAAF